MTAIRPTALDRLRQLGQSIWLDYIERGFIAQGELSRLIEEGISGVTSNPTIFHRAIADSRAYDASIAGFIRDGVAAHEIYEALVVEDIRAAADVLAVVHERTDGREGFVSLEVSPHLARDADGTYWEAKRLWTLLDRRNAMVKIPATEQGVAAVRRLTADAINVNVTLLFGAARCAAVAEAFTQGLEDRLSAGLPVAGIASVASLFLSRIDTMVDRRLESLPDSVSGNLRGRCAESCAKVAYQSYVDQMGSGRWRALLAAGGRPQRLLWASTATKNPRYSDVKYVEALIGRDTITTLPPETYIAYRDHGDPALRLAPSGCSCDARNVLERLEALGIGMDDLQRQLETEGIAKFVEPFEATLAALRNRIAPVS